jgi:hypothetical protein
MELVASLARPGGNITGMSAPTADGRQRPLGIAALEDKIITRLGGRAAQRHL